jgi:hypothetical protein
MAVRLVVTVVAATVSVTVPLPVPVPFAGLTTVIQLGWFATVQPHTPVVVTVTEAVPPLEAIDALVDEIAYLHAGAAACVTVTVCPATVTVALRLVVAVFGPAVTVTLPFPVPLVGLRVNHVAARPAPPDAVQLHPDAVLTVSAALPPPAAIDAPVGVTV